MQKRGLIFLISKTVNIFLRSKEKPLDISIFQVYTNCIITNSTVGTDDTVPWKGRWRYD